MRKSVLVSSSSPAERRSSVGFGRLQHGPSQNAAPRRLRAHEQHCLSLSLSLSLFFSLSLVFVLFFYLSSAIARRSSLSLSLSSFFFFRSLLGLEFFPLEFSIFQVWKGFSTSNMNYKRSSLESPLNRR